MQYPKLRPLSAFPVELSDGQYICLQDPDRHLEKPVVISPNTFFIIQFFDGQHSFVDIQEAYLRQYGTLLYTEQIQQIVDQLDNCFLLESPAFFEHLRKLREEFARLPVRPSSHQGTAYPDNSEKLASQLESYFTASEGPGHLSVHQTSSFDSASPIKISTPKAIMAPHIDIEAGGPTFAWAYHALAGSDVELFIILGTAHVDMKNFFALTKKSFETPFGRMEIDQSFIEALADQLSYDPFEDELIHKNEHSIEFQVLFLQYLYGEQPIKIVPILCGGSVHEMIALNHPLDQTPQFEESVTCLQRLFQAYPKACVIASVDFSHVGIRYGDRAGPNAETLKKVEHVDRNLLAAMENVAHEEFIAQLQQHRNATQICGVAPIYTLLRLLDGTKGTLLHYDRAETGPGSIVTFASMVWEEN
jgi:AmmeMemoRadiSam system protein B